MANPQKKTYAFEDVAATRSGILLRAAFCGPTGSGKTKTALILATRMVEKMNLGPVFLIDSERKSAAKYAPSRTGNGHAFRHVPMPEDDYSPDAYMAALDYCEAKGAGVVIIDSMSHAWNGINGVLELVDQKTAASRTKNTFSEGWREMTPIQNRMVQHLFGCGVHLLLTYRAKTEYVIQENERGKKEPVKMGLGAVAREGTDYEPDVWFDMTVPNNDLIVGKSRCDLLAPGDVFKKPGIAFSDIVIAWLTDAGTSAVARSLGEAITIAALACAEALRANNGEAYMAATSALTSWCKANGVSADRHTIAQGQVRERAAQSTGGLAIGGPGANVGAATNGSDAAPKQARAETDADTRALAADLERKIKEVESADELTDIEGQIRTLPEALRPRLRVAYYARRIDFAVTPAALDALAAHVTAQKFGDRGAAFLVERVAGRRADIEAMQAPAPAMVG